MSNVLRPALAGLALAGATGAGCLGLASAAIAAPGGHPAAAPGGLPIPPGARPHRRARRPERAGHPRTGHPRAGHRRRIAARRRLVPTGPAETGVASWYDGGGTTADGQPFDPQAMAAASPTLPFGTLLRVCRPSGPCVVVRVDDRGPYTGGRILDLTPAAAGDLNFLSAGTADVVATPVRVTKVVAEPDRPARRARRGTGGEAIVAFPGFATRPRRAARP